jgi:uncharacterized protein YaeQ
VHVLAYGGRAVDLWWQGVAARLERQARLTVLEIPVDASKALAKLADRSMKIQVTVQEGHVYVVNGVESVAVDLRVIKAGPSAR